MNLRQRPTARTAPASRSPGYGRLAYVTLTLVLAAASQVAVAGLYKCRNANGTVIYADAPCSFEAAASSTARNEDGGASSPPPAGGLTEKQVRALMTEYDNAARRLDADAMLGLLSDDARVEIYVRRAGATGRRTFRKNEYAKFMRDALSGVSGYASRRENLHIALAPTGMQAEVNSRISEDWRQAGQALTRVSDEQYLIELRDGKPRVVWVHVTSTGEPRVKK
jgi:Domain of unknown function (DUF4124)